MHLNPLVAAILLGSAAATSACSSAQTQPSADAGSSSDVAAYRPPSDEASVPETGASEGASDADSADLRPVGGPDGYSTLATSDSFGDAKPSATITAISQLDPNTPHGLGGTGWDRWMKYGAESAGNYAAVTMQADHLEIAPTTPPHVGFIVSHFEALPTASKSYYFEVRAATGRGGCCQGVAWPAIWFYAGNESTADNHGSAEIDVMETYANQAHGSLRDDAGLYEQYFTSAAHIGDAGGITSPENFLTLTDGIDVTTTYNVFGCELVLIDGTVQWRIYFNGMLEHSSKIGIVWKSTAPAIIIGWGPGSSPYTPAILKLDWVRVWSK